MNGIEIDKQDQFREQSVPILSQIEVQEIETAHKSVVSPCFHLAAKGGEMRGMREDLSPTLLSHETYSPTRRAGWGLNTGLGTVELGITASHQKPFL